LVEYPHSRVSGVGAEELLRKLRWRNIAQGFRQVLLIETRDPLQRRVLHIIEAAQGATTMDHLSLVQSDHRLGAGVVVRITNAPH